MKWQLRKAPPKTYDVARNIGKTLVINGQTSSTDQSYQPYEKKGGPNSWSVSSFRLLSGILRA